MYIQYCTLHIVTDTPLIYRRYFINAACCRILQHQICIEEFIHDDINNVQRSRQVGGG